MTLKSAATGDSTFGQLIMDLLEAFPQPIDLDYFAYSGVAQTEVLMDESQISRFERLASFTSMLFAEEIINADKFHDGSINYFWNVCLTVNAYDVFRRYFRDKTLNDITDIISIIVAIPKNPTQNVRARNEVALPSVLEGLSPAPKHRSPE